MANKANLETHFTPMKTTVPITSKRIDPMMRLLLSSSGSPANILSSGAIFICEAGGGEEGDKMQS